MSAQKNKTILALTLAVIAVFLLGGFSLSYFPTQQFQQQNLPANAHVMWTAPEVSNLTLQIKGPTSNTSDHQYYWVATRQFSMDTVCIGGDGSLNATSAAIRRQGDTYTFTGNIVNQTILVQKDNIILDGAGYTLQGWSQTIGDQATAINIHSRNNITITSLNIKQFTIPIWVQNSTGVTVKNSNITQGYPYAILMESTNRTQAVHNIFLGSMVELQGCSNNLIDGNTFSSSHTGVADYSGRGNMISHNNFVTVNTSVLSVSDDSAVTRNVIVNGDTGIFVKGKGFDVSENAIANCTTSLTVTALNSFIYANNVWNSTTGLQLNSNSAEPQIGNNTYTRNNFENITRNLEIITASKVADHWDDGGEGNYWSNYTGADGNGDGIGDSPYYLDANNIDNYPLVQPYGIQSTNPQMGQYFFIIAALAALVGVLAIGAVYLKFRAK